jgi:hypothetical protein
VVPGVEHPPPQEIVGVEVEGELRQVCFDEGDHPAVLDADDVGGILAVHVIGPVTESHGGNGRLHFYVILDGDGHSEKIGEMPIAIPLLIYGDVGLSSGKTLLVALSCHFQRAFKVVFCDYAQIPAHCRCSSAIDGDQLLRSDLSFVEHLDDLHDV